MCSACVVLRVYMVHLLLEGHATTELLHVAIFQSHNTGPTWSLLYNE